MIEVDFILAFLAGLVSFLSPCVLPLAPPYLSYLAGVSAQSVTVAGSGPDGQQSGQQSGQQDGQQDGAGKKHSVSLQLTVIALFFIAGFSTVFMLLGLTAFALGRLLLAWLPILTIIAGLVIILMGLHFLGIMRVSIFYRDHRFRGEGRPGSMTGAYVMGLAFGFGWTPCIGPVLATILAVAAVEATAWRGALLLGSYALGLGLPFLLAALFMGRFMVFANWFRRYAGVVERVMGAGLVIVGLMIMTGWMQIFAFWLLETLPFLARLG